MDPNETLKRLRTIVYDGTNNIPGDRLASLDGMVELFSALDEWITRGGFLPAEWAKNR